MSFILSLPIPDSFIFASEKTKILLLETCSVDGLNLPFKFP
jgi:hypothetical protein